jgi:hypothetical protein
LTPRCGLRWIGSEGSEWLERSMQLAAIAVSFKDVESVDMMPLLYARNDGRGVWSRTRLKEIKCPSLIGPYEKSLQLRLPQFGCSANVQEAMGIFLLFRRPHKATKVCAVWVENGTKLGVHHIIFRQPFHTFLNQAHQFVHVRPLRWLDCQTSFHYLPNPFTRPQRLLCLPICSHCLSLSLR